VVDDVTMRQRMAAARVARLATVRPDGTPHIVPCCFVLDGDTIYSAVDAKPKTTLALQRLANVRANPHASLVVDHYDDDWSQLWWIRVDGDARVVERDDAVALLQAKYPQYAQTPPLGALIAIGVTRWRAWTASP
jgi:PPOX class probable F420-dependent enzyme